MEECLSFPPIDPSNFDLIVVGTGLAESVIAAAASAAGKTVLHIDANPFYGSHFSTLSLSEIASFLENSHIRSAPTTCFTIDTTSSNYNTLDLSTRTLISEAEVSMITPDLELGGRFSLDISGPRVIFCADSLTNLIIKTGISEYFEFKSINGSYIYEPSVDGCGALTRVPVNKEIFKDKSLTRSEKLNLGQFIKLVQKHLKLFCSGESDGEETEPVISPQDLESPFVEFLERQRLSPKARRIILYGIVMTNDDQEKDGCQHLLKTEDAINRLAIYLSSMVRFQDSAPCGMLYPMYGLGELPQAFCRRAAVKGCIYVLRMPMAGLLIDKDTGLYKGVKLASGQTLFSEKLIVEPCIAIPQSLSSNNVDDNLEHSEQPRISKGKVARAICIMKRSVVADNMDFRIVYPPRSLYPEQKTVVQALQISNNFAVCPSNTFVLYLSTPCEDALEGKMLLKAAIKALCVFPDEICHATSEDNNTLVQDDQDDSKPILLWRALYVQEVLEVNTRNFDSSGSVISSPSPDEDLSYENLIDSALKLFCECFPEAEIFPVSEDDEAQV